MNEIKTDLFPEVLRRKAGRTQERNKEIHQGGQSNAVMPTERAAEPFRQGKDGNEQ